MFVLNIYKHKLQGKFFVECLQVIPRKIVDVHKDVSKVHIHLKLTILYQERMNE